MISRKTESPMELSIITVNRNNSQGLDATIKSVETQTYTDFEYIIIDGNSTDESVDIIRQHESAGLNIQWISEDDTGIFDAMNKGIGLASGEYLLFLNSGDILDSNDVLQDLFSTSHSADILIGECRVMKDDRQIWLQTPRDRYTLKSVINDSIPHQSSFIKKSLFEQYGFYRTDLKIMGDWEFFIRTIVLQDCSVEPIHLVISRYDATGISSNPQSQELIRQEKSKVFSDLHLSNVIPDYAACDDWYKKNEPIIWASNKKGIKLFLELLYKLARKMNRLFRR